MRGFALRDPNGPPAMGDAACRQARAVWAPAIRSGARLQDIRRCERAHGKDAEAVGREAARRAQRPAAHADPPRDLARAPSNDPWIRVRERRKPPG
jgi:hypothetical protein